jgi:serine/threonine protein kinase
VAKGVWNVSKNSLQIAIKQLLPNTSTGEGVKLLQEAAIMGQFSHPNVVKLYGLVTLGNPVRERPPVCILFPYFEWLHYHKWHQLLCVNIGPLMHNHHGLSSTSCYVYKTLHNNCCSTAYGLHRVYEMWRPEELL